MQLEQIAREFIREHDLDIELGEDVVIKVSGRLTRASGNWRHREDGPNLIKISRHVIENKSYEEIKGVIRHEVGHEVDYRRRGRTDDDWKFQQLSQELDFPMNAEGPAREYQYLVECQECGHQYGRQQKSKIIKQPEKYRCGECNGELERVQ